MVKKHNLNFAVIIPAYNEEKRIGRVINEVKKITNNIIVIDDGSKDNTYKVASKYKILTLRHKVNLGQGAALKTGIEAAIDSGIDIFITLDADGQHKPEQIPNFIQQINSGYDIVFGTRKWSKDVPLIRFLGNKFASFLINLLFGIYRSDITCGYMAMTKSAFRKINWESSRYGAQTEIVCKTGKFGLNFSESPVEIIYYDKYKGVTIIDAVSILPSVIKWKLF